jgi:hypothetical protein
MLTILARKEVNQHFPQASQSSSEVCATVPRNASLTPSAKLNYPNVVNASAVRYLIWHLWSSTAYQKLLPTGSLGLYVV